MVQTAFIIQKTLFCFRFDSAADIAAFFFMFQNSAVKFVHQNINRGVHILFNRFNVQIFACQMDIGFSFLADFFHRERDGHGNDVVGVAADSCQLVGNVVFDGFGNIKIQTGDFQIHDTAPSVG